MWSLPRCVRTGSAGLRPAPPRLLGRLRLRLSLGQADFPEFGGLGNVTRALLGDDGASSPVCLRQAELGLCQRGRHQRKTRIGSDGSFTV